MTDLTKQHIVRAKEHHEAMKSRYEKEISQCVKDTIIYKDKDYRVQYKNAVSVSINPTKHFTDAANVRIIDSMTANVLSQLTGRTIILNFASYKSSGGGYLFGSLAQEESLCHESTLFEVLSNFKLNYYAVNEEHLNYGFYENVALYTPNVKFTNGAADVLTCAAPNLVPVQKYRPQLLEKNTNILNRRVQFILQIMANKDPDHVILGAWGCGVFRQKAPEVAEAFRKGLNHYKFKDVIFAIPDKDGFNYKSFEEVFSCGTNMY